ncbi:hemophore [Mycobacterium sp. NPDC003323]
MSSVPSGITAKRRGLFAAFAGCLVGGAAVVLVSTPSAVAETDPCEASEIAKTIGSVATSMGNYLDTHPDTNQALTAIAAQPAGPQSLAAAKAYFDAKPGAARDIQRLQAPLVRLSTECQLPISLPQVLGLMQAVQTPAAGLPAVAEVAAPVVAGTGPRPGPA